MHVRPAALALLLVLSGALGTVAVAESPSPAATQDAPCRGTLTGPANGTTVVSVQGARFGEERGKTQARLVAFGPRGRIKWTYNHTGGVVWSYDVDPLPNGNLFVTATRRGRTDIFEFDPSAQERVWTRVLNFTDTHDADMINRTHVAIANMRNYRGESGENRDRLLVYDRKADEVVWEWRFADHYPRAVGGNYSDDWTHVNDIDPVGDRYFLASPRNFDQVVLVDRQTGKIELRLGSDGNHSVLRSQHNPDYLTSERGRPTFLVADSENDRVVEYERRGGNGSGGEWARTWELGGDAFDWPRDADRLPDGNTLVADSRNDRVVEVTPEGEVVWEVYAPWLVYDAERIRHGDGSTGPTVADMDATGSYPLSGAAGFSASRREACDRAISSFDGDWQPRGTTSGGSGGSGGSGAGTTTVAPGATVGVAVLAVGLALVAAVLIYRR